MTTNAPALAVKANYLTVLFGDKMKVFNDRRLASASLWQIDSTGMLNSCDNIS
jgi:hypothetical protein